MLRSVLLDSIAQEFTASGQILIAETNSEHGEQTYSSDRRNTFGWRLSTWEQFEDDADSVRLAVVGPTVSSIKCRKILLKKNLPQSVFEINHVSGFYLMVVNRFIGKTVYCRQTVKAFTVLDVISLRYLETFASEIIVR